MIEKRYAHACLFDETTNSVYVMGGENENYIMLDSMEKWTIGTNWWLRSGNLVKRIADSRAVSAKSKHYVGYMTGGWSSGVQSNEIWGLRRLDMRWKVFDKKLKIRRVGHSMLNIPLHQVLECKGFIYLLVQYVSRGLIVML